MRRSDNPARGRLRLGHWFCARRQRRFTRCRSLVTSYRRSKFNHRDTEKQMQAAVLYGREDMRVENVEAAKLKRGEVRVRIRAALTCGTDLKVFKRGYHANMIRPPSVFGHELAGEICEVASGARGWKMGDRVVVANSAPCGRCFYCKNRQEGLCDDLLFLN